MEIKWEDLTGPSVIVRTRTPGLVDSAQITNPTQVSTPRDMAPLGGQNRMGESEGRDARSHEAPWVGRDSGARKVATPAKVQEESQGGAMPWMG